MNEADTFRELSIGHLIRRRDYLVKVLFNNSHLALPNTNRELNEVKQKITEYQKNEQLVL